MPLDVGVSPARLDRPLEALDRVAEIAGRPCVFHQLDLRERQLQGMAARLAADLQGGEPCPVCATPIRTTGVRGHDAFFCPRCQHDAKGRGFVDWRKVPR